MIYRFGDCELDTELFELRRGGAVQHIEPQVFDILRYLVERHGRCVPKDELHEGVWRGRLVSEAALSSRIRSVRQVIGDNGSEQRLIRTVHGRGFRFIAPVTIQTADGPDEAQASARQRCEWSAPPPSSDARRAIEREHVVDAAAGPEALADGAEGHRFAALPGRGNRAHWAITAGALTLLVVFGMLTWGAISPEEPRSSAAACSDHLGLPVPADRCAQPQQ